ncbi:MAG TPA: small acid-soluble spore protein H [Ureibacillus sp.]|nr:small acid-soluble spore protein H [Ureibacillus sp.]
MNIQRAQEIAESGHLAKVFFNGERVFIQHVDEQKETARIYPLDDPQKEQEVALSSLQERMN